MSSLDRSSSRNNEIGAKIAGTFLPSPTRPVGEEIVIEARQRCGRVLLKALSQRWPQGVRLVVNPNEETWQGTIHMNAHRGYAPWNAALDAMHETGNWGVFVCWY